MIQVDENQKSFPIPHGNLNPMTPNTEWKKAGLSLCAAAVLLLACIFAYTSMDGMSGGYALAFIAFFLTTSSIAVCLLYVHRASVMDLILNDPNPLAHWVYPDEMARETVEREYHEYLGRNRAMFIVIGGMLSVVALFFILLVREGGPETGVFLLILAAVLLGVSRAAPLIERKRARGAPPEALITHNGVVYRGSVYPFRSFMVSRPKVSFRNQENRAPAAVVLSFVQLVGTILQPFDITIPVPTGMEESAQKIVRELGGSATQIK